jgi:hypothetical protein
MCGGEAVELWAARPRFQEAFNSHSAAELLYNVPMMKVLEEAIEKVRKLPEERQAYVAEVLEQIAAAGSDVFTVPEGHREAVLEGLGQAERGEFMDDDEMAALWKKCGL